MKRCPNCDSDHGHCPECGATFEHGSHSRCNRPACVKVNAPIDCTCGLVVDDKLLGVLDHHMQLLPWKNAGRTRPNRLAISVYFGALEVSGKPLTVKEGGYLVDEELEVIRAAVEKAVRESRLFKKKDVTVTPPIDMWAGCDDPNYRNEK